MLNPSFPLPLTLKSKQRQKWGQHILTLNSPGRFSEWHVFSSLTFDVSGGRSHFHACLRRTLEYEWHSGVSKLTLHVQRVLYCTSPPSCSEFVSASDVNRQCVIIYLTLFFLCREVTESPGPEVSRVCLGRREMRGPVVSQVFPVPSDCRYSYHLYTNLNRPIMNLLQACYLIYTKLHY